MCYVCFFFFKQKTAYEMRISDWSSDVCSSDLLRKAMVRPSRYSLCVSSLAAARLRGTGMRESEPAARIPDAIDPGGIAAIRSAAHRAVFCQPGSESQGSAFGA